MAMPLRHVLAAGSAVAALTLSACAGATNVAAPSEDNAAQVDSKVESALTVGSDLTYPPYDMLVDGKPAGFDVDMMNALADTMGTKANFVDTRFAQIIAGIKADRYDVIASTLYISATRAKEVDFVPYFQTGNSIISRADSTAYVTAQDLCGKSVGVVTATVIATILPGEESDKCVAAGKEGITVKEFPSDPEATQALLSNQVDAQMTDGAVAKSVVDKTGDRLELTSTELIYPIAVGLGVKKGNEKMLDSLTEALKKLQSAGTYDTLLEKYNLEPVDPAVLEESMKRK